MKKHFVEAVRILCLKFLLVRVVNSLIYFISYLKLWDPDAFLL